MLTLFLGGIFGTGVCFLWGAFTSAAAFNAGAADADTPRSCSASSTSCRCGTSRTALPGLASGTTQAVINTYGTGLDTPAPSSAVQPRQATLLACGLWLVLVYVGHFYDRIEEVGCRSTCSSWCASRSQIHDRGLRS